MAEWTPEEDATLHRMWILEGHSAGFIASSAFPDRSRNAVIGRVHRMGWARREPYDLGKRLAYPGQRKGTLTVGRKAGSGNSVGSIASLFIGHRKKPITSELPPFKGADIASPDAKPWLQRAFGECAFPLDGRGEGADTVSCCNPTGGLTYCLPHQALMVNPNRYRKVNPSDVGASARKPKEHNGIFSSWLEDAA